MLSFNKRRIRAFFGIYNIVVSIQNSKKTAFYLRADIPIVAEMLQVSQHAYTDVLRKVDCISCGVL